MLIRCTVLALAVLLTACPSLAGQWEMVHVFPQWLVLLDIACASPNDVWVAGVNEMTNTNQIYHSTDGGETWTMQYSGMDLSVFMVGMDAADKSTAFIAGTYVFAFSADGCGAMTSTGGSSWNPVDPADPFVASFRSVNARSSQEAHLVGSWGFGDTKGLYSTFNGGASWTHYSTVPATHALLFADFSGSQNIWATGGAWPEKGGRSDHYSEAFEPHVRRLFSETAADPMSERETLPGQYESSIWYSSNGGGSWTQQLSNVGIGYMGGIDMVDAAFGIAVGAGDFTAQIYRTTNGGATWPRISFPSENDHILADIEMVSAAEGWAVGYSPDGPGGQPGTAIVGTTDGGLSWAREPINEATALLGVSMYDEHRGFTCGGNNLKISRVLRYDDGYYTGTAVETAEAEGRLMLSQNQPNPFNPRTTLAFRLPREQRARLAVYDVQGQRVALLADRVFSPGEQSLVWDGTDDRGVPAPAGVYFARLVAGEVSESRKLVLVR